MKSKEHMNRRKKPTAGSRNGKRRLYGPAFIVLIFCTLFLLSCAGGGTNVILMVPDGMGLADVTAARIGRHGMKPVPLRFETLDHIGYQRTFSADGTITDSAAAASAWACGEKFLNREICHHRDGRATLPSVLELAKKHGKSTGLVVTEAITGATPAAFAAHVPSRDCRKEIARQYIEKSGVDVLLGGGRAVLTSKEVDACGTGGDLLQSALANGYVVVHDRHEMERAVSGGARKVLGLFAEGSLTPEYLRKSGCAEPRLPEMAAAALNVLEKNREGFFLLIEGSLVDKANHKNDFPYQLGEVLAFDEAVSVVRAWIDADPERKGKTLLIVASDHETGGFAVTGQDPAGNSGEWKVKTAWTGKDHTGVDTILWSSGPGSERLGRALDNTDLYRVMVDALN